MWSCLNRKSRGVYAGSLRGAKRDLGEELRQWELVRCDR